MASSHGCLGTGCAARLPNAAATATSNIVADHCAGTQVRTAVELKADKLICMHMEDVAALRLPEWLSVAAAEALFEAMTAKGPADIADAPSRAASQLLAEVPALIRLLFVKVVFQAFSGMH